MKWGKNNRIPRGYLIPAEVARKRVWKDLKFLRRSQPNVSWPDSEIYERPHVLVTSPGSPDRHEAPVLGQGPTSVGGRVQIRLGFDTATLQLFVTIVCATGLRPRSEQQARNPYCKLFLLPDRSEKSKRRTRTLGGTTEPMWNQTFVYSGLRRADLRLRSLEITVWDYVRYGANDFLGEANVELWPLDEQPTWRQLVPHEEVALTPSEHLSPPSTGSRFSDSDTTSECEIEGSRERRGADGASVSSVGSSSSPPRECERRSRRDQESIAPYKYKRDSMTGARSHSAAPCDTQVVHSSRSRSKSPRRMATDYRSLSPPDCETVVVSGTRFKSRSATATPTGSPKKRQLPQVPHALARALQERVAQDLEDRGANNRRVRYVHHSYRNSGSSWERRYSGLSDSDLTSHVRSSSHRRNVSPDRDRDPLGLGDFDSDMESVASVTSSSFSTQSERPRGTRMSSAEYSNYSSGGYQMTRNSTASDRGSDRDTMDSLDSHHHSHPDDQNHHHHHHHHHHRREGTVKRGQFTRSLSNTEPPSEDKADGSLSDTAVSQLHGLDVPHRERKDGRDRDRQNQFSGLNKKSSSTSQLSATAASVRYRLKRTISSCYLPWFGANELFNIQVETFIFKLFLIKFAKNQHSQNYEYLKDSEHLDESLSKTFRSFYFKPPESLEKVSFPLIMRQTVTVLSQPTFAGKPSQKFLNKFHRVVENDEWALDVGGKPLLLYIGRKRCCQAMCDCPNKALQRLATAKAQLMATDTGLARKRTSTTTPPSIQRSQEVVPMIPPRSSEGSQRASSLNSISSSEGSSWSPSLRLTGEGQLAEFIEGLGPGQLVGRQVLGAPSLGDIQLSLCHQRGVLEVEIIRARGLQARTGSKVLPAPYVKVYLVCGKKCYAKAKTQQARRTLDPLYQKQVTFKENYTNCILQVTVWGDYGRIEGKKVFMGVAQIMLDDLNLSNIVIGWYKLFGTTSLVKIRPTTLWKSITLNRVDEHLAVSF
ncbi:hypothetical protein HUJ04_005605 [Dendroctonus ponderosae]|nr:hypothetical protein HUJ04_005605 [Dendroctonus ponderosae]